MPTYLDYLYVFYRLILECLYWNISYDLINMLYLGLILFERYDIILMSSFFYGFKLAG